MTDEMSNEVEVFKNAIMDDDITIQLDAVKRIALLASALEAKKTREELLPCIANYVDAMPEELGYHLAEELERFVPLVGGSEHIGIILEILIKLSYEDEVLVRERAVQALNTISNSLNEKECCETFYPLIEELINNDWFTSKCSAASLIAGCYQKMSEERKNDMRHIFRNLIQDDSPMVRRAAENGLINFITVIDPEQITSEFVPVFHNLAVDEQDSVRVLSVDVGIAIAKKLKDFEVHEYLIPTFKLLSVDLSWRVRQRLVFNVHKLQNVTDKSREDLVSIYKECAKDCEAEVRAIAAETLFSFTTTLKSTFAEDSTHFEAYFVEKLMPQIKLLLVDANDDVRLSLSTNILSLSTILTNDCFKDNILPLIITSLENEESTLFKENVLKNLNSLPVEVDITKSLTSIQNVIRNLLDNSQMHWRTRRNLLLAFAHITKTCSSEFFDENLKIFYVNLLNDPVYAIRRTAPLILPLLIKQYGMEWTKESLIPVFLSLSTDNRYLFRYVCLFTISELINPTVDTSDDQDRQYLKGLDQSLETLFKISTLTDRLTKRLLEDDVLKGILAKPSDYNGDNVYLYGEDTLENLKDRHGVHIWENRNDDKESYLEGILTILTGVFMDTVKSLLEDPIENVRITAAWTLSNINRFVKSVNEELLEAWVQESLVRLTADDITRIRLELEEDLHGQEELKTVEEPLDVSLSNEQGDNKEGFEEKPAPEEDVK